MYVTWPMITSSVRLTGSRYVEQPQMRFGSLVPPPLPELITGTFLPSIQFSPRTLPGQCPGLAADHDHVRYEERVLTALDTFIQRESAEFTGGGGQPRRG